MRIAFIVSGVALNGVAVEVVRLTRQLVARGHDLTVVCRPGSWPERQLGGVAHVVTSDLHRWPGDELRRISKLIEDRGCDLVNTHMSRAHFFGVLLKAWVGVPIIATAHGGQIQPHWMLNDHVIAVSQPIADFHRRWNLVRSDRLTVVHNFVEIPPFEFTAAERAQARAELGVDDSCVLIGKPGNIFREKGLHHLIEAMPAVLAHAPRSRLVLRGRGPDDYRRALVVRSRDLGVESRITWVPEVDPDQVRHTYAALDILVVPSLKEPLSTVCLEGMAAALPVVATTVGGHPEIVENGRTGLLVPPGSPRALAQALIELAGDGQKRVRFGAAGRERVRCAFSPEQLVAETERVFARVIAGKTRRAAR